MSLPTAIFSHFAAKAEATRFRQATDRFELDREPEGGRDRTYNITVGHVVPVRSDFATGQQVRSMSTLNVQLAYFRGGGDAGGGDRKSINRQALDDMFALVALAQDPEGYDPTNTGIRRVRFLGYQRLADLPRSEIWQVSFDVEWEAELT